MSSPDLIEHLRRRADDAEDIAGTYEAICELTAYETGKAELAGLVMKACIDRRQAADEIERLRAIIENVCGHYPE